MPSAAETPSRYAVRPEWLAQVVEEALEPDIPIVDAHHHLWQMPGARYLFEELLTDLSCGHRIIATVFVQCYAMHRAHGPKAFAPVGETEFANGIAAMSASGGYGPTAVCSGIIGFADLRLGAAVDNILDAHLRAAADRFRGIRHITAWDADPALFSPANASGAGLLADAAFREGFSRLGPRGLSFDAWLLSPQIGELADLAGRFPETIIVLDHLGTPPGIGTYASRRDEVFDTWRAAIKRLSKHANVRVKLGGMAQHANGFAWRDMPKPPSSKLLASEWLPYFDTCIEHFSPARCMFESNFPVDKGACSYGVFWNACKRLVNAFSPAEKASMFAGTALETYRLEAMAGWAR